MLPNSNPKLRPDATADQISVPNRLQVNINGLSSQDEALVSTIMNLQLGPLDAFQQFEKRVGTFISDGHERSRVFIAREELDKPNEGRTLYLRLERPIKVDNSEVSVLRFKGVRPRFDSTGAVEVYRGWGVQGIHLQVMEDGCLYAQHLGNDALSGAIKAQLAKAEFDMMSFARGRFSADTAVAWGATYNSMDDLGVVVAGMPSLGDIRLKMDRETGALGTYLLEEDVWTPLDEHALHRVLFDVGSQLRALHDSGWIHVFPYWGNIGLDRDCNGEIVRVILRDLDGCMALTGEDIQQARYRFQDVARVLSEMPRGGAGSGNATEEFLRGYFKEQDISLLLSSVSSRGFQRQYFDMLDDCVFIELSIDQEVMCKRVINIDDTLGGHAFLLPERALRVQRVENHFAPLMVALLSVCQEAD